MSKHGERAKGILQGRYDKTAMGLALDLGFPAGSPEERFIMRVLSDVERETIESVSAMIEKLRDEGKFAPESPGLLADLAFRVRAMLGEIKNEN